MKSISVLLILSVLLFSCSSEKKSDAEKKTEKKKDLQDPELQNMMNHLNEDSQEVLADGFHELTYPNGKIKSTGTISNGNKEGLWTHFREDGTKWSECNFQAGKSHGKVVSYHPNGRVNYIGYFTGGEKSGNWMFYDLEGKLVKELDMNKKLKENKK